MRTLALLSMALAVALGLPFEKKEAQAPLPEADQRPLVGDLLPVQGHVMVENPAPQPGLSKDLQVSDSHPDIKGQMPLSDQEEHVRSESTEGSLTKTDLSGDKKEIEREKNYAPIERANLKSGLNEFTENGGVGGDLEEKAEIIETVVKQNQNKPNQELHRESPKETKYNLEQPMMELEPLTDEEMQQDGLLHPSYMDNAVYEDTSMFLESEGSGHQFMKRQNVPQAVAMEQGPMLIEQLEMLPSEEQVVQGRRSCPGVVLEGKCFQFFTNPKKAADAEYFCQETFPDGHLAAITSPNIHNEMMNLMRQNGGTRRTWVGGIRFLDTGRFVWLDGSHWLYADWLWGEPNNTSNLEDCIEVLASGKFNDFTCWEPQAFICSYPYH
ncbi:hypothetical protein NQD34_015415 [Periophthalmus magnuspinnatus]|nr:hypothetical protein NQD34_015415 [Periophthalmus magnuspinnatus]